MDDDKLKNLGVINPKLVEKMKKIQETMIPAAKVMQDVLKNMPKIPDVWIKSPTFELPPIPIDQNLASEFNRRLKEWVTDFDNSLDQEHEVGVRLVTFGQSVTFHLENIGNWNPSLISFTGFMENGDPVELIQHVSQISILLVKMKRKEPDKPKRPIGFASWSDDEKTKT